MTSKGAIVEGSVTDRTLAYLRDHPGGWTIKEISEVLDVGPAHIAHSLDSLRSSFRVRRLGTRRHPPVRFSYVQPERQSRSAADILADALIACPLYAIRPAPRDPAELEAAWTVAHGMPPSRKNGLMVIAFEGQRAASNRRPELARPRAGTLEKRTRAAKLGAAASFWKKRAAV